MSRSGDAASDGYWEGISGRDGSPAANHHPGPGYGRGLLALTRAGLAWVAEAQVGVIKVSPPRWAGWRKRWRTRAASRRTGVGPSMPSPGRRCRHQRRRPGYVASWGRGGAFAHRFGDRYRTLRAGEGLRVGAVGVRAVAPPADRLQSVADRGSPY